MRLAATLIPVRDAARQSVALRGTMRDVALLPHEVVIYDLSTSGFLAELPGDIEFEPGTPVRVAATPIGVNEAFAVRRDGRYFGFSFTRPLSASALAAAEGEQESSVSAFPGDALPAVAASAPADGGAAISARASLLVICGVAGGLWTLLAGVVWATATLN